jgi:anthranilate phosphoribosyltransferase
VDEVLDLGDPYDGYNRTLPAAPFLPPLLAACGVAAVSHGVQSMGPKYGVTHRQVLAAAGLPVDLSPRDAAARLGDPRIGWAYVDQKAFCPKLYALARLRTLIVKRPAITTAEVLAGPLRGRRKTHLVTGYVHKAYPRVYALLARHAGFDTALIVRGVEGGVIPSLAQAGRAYRVLGDAVENVVEFAPAELGIEPAPRSAQTVSARAAADAGRAALEGAPGPVRDGLICGAALCLWHLGRHGSLRQAAEAARGALDDGRALARLDQAI